MSDSTEDKNNELDSYGVWVKNSSQETISSDSNEQPLEMSFSDTLDLPDFDEIPNNEENLNIFGDSTSLETPIDESINDTTLNTDELMNITNNADIIEKDEESNFTDTNDLNTNIQFDDIQFEEPVIEETSVDNIETNNSSDSNIDSVLETGIDLPEFSDEIDNSLNFDEELNIFENNENSDNNIEMPVEENSDSNFEMPVEESLESNFEMPVEENSDSNFAMSLEENPENKIEEELSLDDFMDGGFSDESVAAGNNGYAPGEEISSSGSSEEISLDDFLDGNGFEGDKPEEETIVDEKPLEMDLNFDSSVDSIETEENQFIEKDFDDEDDAFEETINESDSETKQDEPTQLDFNKSQTETFDSEEINLSDFGIDENAEETPVTQDINEAKIVEEVIDYDLSVSSENTTSAPIVNEIKEVEETEKVEDLDVLDDEIQENTKSATVVDNSLLQQIVSDLSSLKDEINNLKSNLSEMKNQNSIEKESDTLNFENADTQTDNGFFSSDDGDDTIALSNDELNNIMTNADFNSVDESNNELNTELQQENENNNEVYENIEDTIIENQEPTFDETSISEKEVEENTCEEVESKSLAEEFAINMENEDLKEPDLDNVDVEETSDELPEEITIEKDDNILVESSNSDFMDSIQDSTETLENNNETFTDVFEEKENESENNDIFDSVDESFVTDETKTEITESNLNYLTSEKNDIEGNSSDNNSELKKDIKSVLLYMDQLLENLPEDKIIEFAKSDEFSTYKKLFSELGLS